MDILYCNLTFAFSSIGKKRQAPVAPRQVLATGLFPSSSEIPEKSPSKIEKNPGTPTIKLPEKNVDSSHRTTPVSNSVEVKA